MESEKIVCIYIDILIIVNVSVNYLLLLGSSFLTGATISRVRLLIASVLGGLGSLVIFLPSYGEFFGAAVKFFGCIVISAAAFFKRGMGKRELLKYTAAFIGISFLFAGVMFGIWGAFKPTKMYFENGSVYFDIDAATLVITSLAAYAVSRIISKISKIGRLAAGKYFVEIEYNDKKGRYEGFADTGNFLCSGIEDEPVITASLESVREIINDELFTAAKYISEYGVSEDKCSAYDLELIRERYKMRIIPYCTAGGCGIMPAIKPDNVVIVEGKKRFSAGGVWLGLVSEGINGRKIILNPNIVKAEIRENKKERERSELRR